MNDLNAANANLTDLKQRVLAHEQILQGLIAHMVEAEPKFLERLQATFHQPVHLPAGVYKDTAAYAAKFVREVVGMVEDNAENRDASLVSRWDALWPTLGEANLSNAHVPARFEIIQRDDMWELLRNGRLCGGYVSRAGALEAAHSAIHDVFCSGGAAELIAGAPAPSASRKEQTS